MHDEEETFDVLNFLCFFSHVTFYATKNLQLDQLL